MKPKNIVTVVLLVFVIASVAFLVSKKTRDEMRHESAEEMAVDESPVKEETPGSIQETNEYGHKVIVYYFHGTRRCATCRKFEAYTTELMKTTFAQQLKSRKLEFRVVNVDEPQNEHYVYDYKLTTRSVVLADYRDGEEIRWKNLNQIWQCVRDKQVFMDYVRDETEDYMGELLYE